MNLREWARATHKRIAAEPSRFHKTRISISDVEVILSQSVQALTEALSRGDDLRLRDLGRFWVERKAPYSLVSNLPRHMRRYALEEKRFLRFRTSARFAAALRSDKATQDIHENE